MPKRDPLSGFGIPPRNLPSQKELAKVARRSWFVRMAEQRGFVLAPGDWKGKAAALADLWPDVFPNEQVARKYVKLDRMEVVEQHWGENILSATVRLPGRRVWFRLRLHAKTERGAAALLKKMLPQGTMIEIEKSNLGEP